MILWQVPEAETHNKGLRKGRCAMASHAAVWASEAPTPAQLREFFAQIESGKVTKGRLQSFLRGEFAQAGRSIEEQLAAWTLLYREVFGEEHDFSSLTIPAQRPGFNRLIVVAKGMTPNRIFLAMQKLFPAWRYTEDLDQISSVRKADHDYAVWVRDRVEADEEYANKSARDLEHEKVNGITLEERMFFEIIFFRETGKHLDEKNWTLCAGSRGPGGGVPRVYWNPAYGYVYMGWTIPEHRDPGIHARAVVS